MAYTYEEAFEKSLEYFEGDELATTVFLKKYALMDNEGHLLEATPNQMHRRLAKELARIEQKYPNPLSEDEIYSYLDKFKYIILQGSPMYAIGNTYQYASAGNCFVIDPPTDSIGSIMRADQEIAQLQKRRAGVGVNVSGIRPKGMPIKNSAKLSDGILGFVERFSNTTREIAQGGRRGALMECISIKHPDILGFVEVKRDLTKVTGANISIQLNDEFMECVENDKEFELKWPVDSLTPEISRKVSARDLWDEIIESAHSVAEPGLLNWDTCIKYTPSDIYADFGFRSHCTNPCGEIILSTDSCRLILLNLYSFVTDAFESKSKFNFEAFGGMAQKAQRLMDDLVDLEIELMDRILEKIKSDPEPDEEKQIEKNLWEKMKKSCINGRRTGLGITALGDTIAALGMTYGSEESIKLTENIYKSLATNSYIMSSILAKERGAFPIFSHKLEKGHPFLQRIWDASPEAYDLYKKHGRRQIANTTTAPAGSVSILAGTSSGLEPVFMLEYTRRKKINPDDRDVKVDFVDGVGDSWQEFKVYHPGVKKWMDATGETDITKSPYWNSTAEKISWEGRIKLQAAGQLYTDHSLSSTVNLPENVSKEEVGKIYMEAWKQKLKGVTVYREGSRSGVLISSEKKGGQEEFKQNNSPKRPEKLKCDIHQVTVKGEKWSIFIGKLNDKPYELFGGLAEYVNIPRKVKEGLIFKHNGKDNPVARYDLHYGDEDDETVINNITKVFENPDHGAFTRILSLALRHGANPAYIVEQLIKGDQTGDMYSFSKVIARVLKKYIEEGSKVTSDKHCPSCKVEGLVYSEGCVTCKGCGYSKCS